MPLCLDISPLPCSARLTALLALENMTLLALKLCWKSCMYCIHVYVYPNVYKKNGE